MNCLIIVWGLFFNALFFIGGDGGCWGSKLVDGFGKKT